MAKKKTVLTVEITPSEKMTPVPPKKVAPAPSSNILAPVTAEELPLVELTDDTTSAPEKDLTADLAAATGSPIRTRRNTITLAASILVKAAHEGSDKFDWKTCLDDGLPCLDVTVDDSKKYKALRRAVRREALTTITDPVISDRLKLK